PTGGSPAGNSPNRDAHDKPASRIGSDCWRAEWMSASSQRDSESSVATASETPQAGLSTSSPFPDKNPMPPKEARATLQAASKRYWDLHGKGFLGPPSDGLAPDSIAEATS